MNISVKTSKGEVYTIEVEGLESTTLQLKEKIATKVGAPLEKIRLIHSGKLLKNEETLKAYKLEEGSIVHLVVPSCDKKSSPSPEPHSEPQEAAPTNIPGVGRSRSSSIDEGYFSDSAPSSRRSSVDSTASSAGHTGAAGAGQMNPNILKILSDMGGGDQQDMNSVMKERMKELTKNPEMLRMLMTSSLAMQPDIPEETKKEMIKNIDMFIEMAKTNPQGFEEFSNYILDNPNLAHVSNMSNSQTADSFARQMQSMGIGSQGGAQRGPVPNSALNGLSVKREESLRKYATQLQELEKIGYTNVDMNLMALECSDGDLSKAVNLIADWASEETN